MGTVGRRLVALTRPVSPTLGDCELTHLARRDIDVGKAEAQHRAYERALAAAGCALVGVPAAPHLPDAVFVEDTAVVFHELAVVARPGAPSRRPEVDPVAAVLSGYRSLRHIEEPGTLDGGDVLVVGRNVFVGDSARTNADGARQLARIVEPLGYHVQRIEMHGCLHLKTAVTAVDDQTLLLNPEWVSAADFSGYDKVDVHPSEPFAANVLRLGDRLLMAEEHPRTRARLEALGMHVTTVALSELARAEAGATCCSILLRD